MREPNGFDIYFGMAMRYVHSAADQKRLAATKLESHSINGLIEAASEQAVGTKMGNRGVHPIRLGQNCAKTLLIRVVGVRFEGLIAKHSQGISFSVVAVRI
jgi:hypothetical protein